MRLKVVHKSIHKTEGGKYSMPVTDIINAETGEKLEFVKSIRFEHIGGHHAVLQIELLDFELDVELDAEVENAKHEN